MVANLYPIFGKTPANAVTPLTLVDIGEAIGGIAATKISPTVAAGEVGVLITGIFVFTATDTTLDFTLHVKPSGGAFGAVNKRTGVDSTTTPAQLLNTTNVPGLLLLNSTSPVLFLGEGEEIGLQIGAGTVGHIVNVLVAYQKLSV